MMTFEQSVNSKVYINNDEIKIIAIFKDDIAHYLKLTVLLHIVGLIPRGLPRFVIKILRENFYAQICDLCHKNSKGEFLRSNL